MLLIFGARRQFCPDCIIATLDMIFRKDTGIARGRDLPLCGYLPEYREECGRARACRPAESAKRGRHTAMLQMLSYLPWQPSGA